MPEWLALCDLGAPGGGEPWFPHSAVLVFPHKSLDGEFCVVFEFVCFFLVAISIPLMMQRHYRCILAAFHI